MQGIIGFLHYCLEFQQARPNNFVEVVMLFVRANAHESPHFVRLEKA